MKCYYTYRGNQGLVNAYTQAECAKYCPSLAPQGFAFYWNNDASTNGALCAPQPAPPAPAPPGDCYYRYNGQPAGSFPGLSRDRCASYCAQYVPLGWSFYHNNDNSTNGNVCAAPPAPPAPSPAPVNCQVSAWSDSSGCSATACGTQGTKQQSRTVTQNAMYGGTACPSLTQSVSCSAPACPPAPAPAPAMCYYRYNGQKIGALAGSRDNCAAYCAQYVPYGYSFYYNNDNSTDGNVCPTPAPAPVNCQVSGWSDSSACSATACGTQGTKQQSRTVTQNAMYGGAACPTLTQSVSCSAPACAPVDCQVSGWSDSSACSATACGTQGTKQQSRTVTQAPLYGGAACPALTQSVSCSAPACAPVNCQVSGWSGFGTCSATACGTAGTQTRTRTVTQAPLYGGAACPTLAESVSCNAPACAAPAAVNCQVSGWSDSSSCSATVCGTQGTKQQSRTVTQNAMYGGAACPALTQSVSCSAPACAAPAPAPVPVPAPAPAPAPAAPGILGSIESLFWSPSTSVCWRRDKNNNSLFGVEKISQEDCRKGCQSYDMYFNADGKLGNPLCPVDNSPRGTGEPKCYVENKYDLNYFERPEATTREQCAALCDQENAAYWMPTSDFDKRKTICPLNDAPQCWGKNEIGTATDRGKFNTTDNRLVRSRSAQNDLGNTMGVCRELCVGVDDNGKNTDEAINTTKYRDLGMRWFSPRGLADNAQEICMDKNVKRCWYSTTPTGDNPRFWRFGSTGSLEDQKYCASLCENQYYKDVQWGTARDRNKAGQFCANPNKFTTLL